MKKKKTVPKTRGTRFRLFVLPRYAQATDFAQPETITVNVPPLTLKAGLSDDRMYVKDAVNKLPYDEGEYPPYGGPANPDVKPGADGHFDKLDVNSREFLCATMYATVRRTLDIWETYFGRRIPWHFQVDFGRMELIPLVWWDNAQSGWGFLEFGFGRAATGGPDRTKPYCENFDVLAHEMGHSIIFSSVGVPRSNATATAHYGGFHESAADLVALVASLHFQKILDHLLDSSKGNLFSVNELSRIGELTKHDQIRMAFNYEKMSTVGDEPHDLSLPLTGALFDILIEVFQKELVRAALITQDLADRAAGPEGGFTDPTKLQPEFDAAYKGHAADFNKCLEAARDYFGKLLAEVWQHLSPDYFDYADVAKAALEADVKLSAGTHAETIRSCFRWRQISVGNNSFMLRRFSVEDCRPHMAGRSAPLRPHPLAKKPGEGGGGKKAMMVDGDGAESDRDALERSAHSFCVNIAAPWVIPRCDFPTFKSGQTNQFKFHQKQYATPTDQQTDIREFAALLHERLQFGHPCKTNLALATGAVRAVVAVKDEPMQSFLDVLGEHYQ